MAVLYNLIVVNSPIDMDNNILSLTVKVLNNTTPVTDLSNNSFIVHGIDNLAEIPYTLNSNDSSKGLYTILFTNPQPRKDPLMIYAKSTDGTKISKTLYFDYYENIQSGTINTKFNLSHPGTYKFQLDKLNDSDVGLLTTDSITTTLPPDKVKSSIEIVDIDISLVQIITDTGLRIPLKVTLKDKNTQFLSTGHYKVAISDVAQPESTK